MNQAPPYSFGGDPQQKYSPPTSMPYPQSQPPPNYGQPQANYPPPGTGYSSSNVVVPQPTVNNVLVTGSAQLGPNPATMTCHHCRAHLTANINRQCGGYVWMMAGIICLLGLFFGLCWLGCCLLPFCIPSCYDAEHTCPNCSKFVGHYKRM